MIELRPEVREFAEWVELQIQEQEQKCAEWGYTPPELVRAKKHSTCFTSIGIHYVNPTGSRWGDKVSPSRTTRHLVYE
jgi:hypothetical protein